MHVMNDVNTCARVSQSIVDMWKPALKKRLEVADDVLVSTSELYAVKDRLVLLFLLNTFSLPYFLTMLLSDGRGQGHILRRAHDHA